MLRVRVRARIGSSSTDSPSAGIGVSILIYEPFPFELGESRNELAVQDSGLLNILGLLSVHEYHVSPRCTKKLHINISEQPAKSFYTNILKYMAEGFVRGHEISHVISKGAYTTMGRLTTAGKHGPRGGNF